MYQSGASHARLPLGAKTDVSMAEAQTKFYSVGKSVLGSGEDWTPTIVNPSKTGGMLQKMLFIFHIAVWVTALGVSMSINFWGPSDFMSNTTMHGNAYNATENPSDATGLLGYTGGASLVVGVLTLVGSALFVTTDEFKGKNFGMILNVIIQFLTLYGTTTTIYMFSRAAAVTSSKFYPIAFTGVIFTVYAQVLLYCCSAALEVKALPRAFIPSLATSVQIVSAVAINSGDFAPTASDGQKMIATMCPVLTASAVILMFGLRALTRPGGLLSKLNKSDVAITELDISKINTRPFLRSLFLTPYMLAGILSVYKLSFVKLDVDPTSYVFAFFGMLLNFAIIGVVFQPSAELSGAAHDNGDPAIA